MNPLALLKMLSPRAWLEIAGAILVAVVLWKVYDAGENHVKAANERAVHAQEVANAKAERTVGDRIAAALAAYQANTVPPPPAPVPHLVCHNAGGGAVPSRGEAAGGGHGEGEAVPAGAAPTDAGFDPAPAVSAVGLDADAEIDRLQKKVTLLQQVIEAYQAGGMVAK